MKRLVIDSEKCTGCLSCELACSFKYSKKFNVLSKINIKKNKHEGHCKINVCRQCVEAPCVDICPTGALIKDETSGEVEFNENECVGCKQCISACPYNAIVFNDDANIIAKCDLCGGDPICAKVCTTGAITFAEVE